MKHWKRLICLTLVAVLLCTAGAPFARGAESSREIFYGNIQVQPAGSEELAIYRAARDQDDLVYIQVDDFAAAIGGTVTEDTYPGAFRYHIGNWIIIVYTHDNSAEVFYNTDNRYLGYRFYGEFTLEECLYNEKDETWYFPFEQLLYISHAQWLCDERTVFIFRPETLLDVVADMPDIFDGNPSYVDIMGEDVWQQTGNSFKYGFLAAIDDLDMTFILDSILTSFSWKDATSYEDEVLTTALLMLQSDSPSNDSYSSVADGFDGVGEFVSGLANAMDLSGKEQTFELTQSILGLSMTQQQYSSLGDKVGLGATVIDYALGVGQALWARDYMSQSYGERLAFIRDSLNSHSSDKFVRRLSKSAGEAYDLYFGDVCNAYTQISINDIFTLIDGIDKVSGDFGKTDLAVAPLRWAALTVAVFDTGVEVLKANSSAVRKALDEAEDIHLSLDLVNISTVLRSAYQDATAPLTKRNCRVTQDMLDDIRISAQISQCASMHAREKLIAVGKLFDGAKPEQAILQRLDQSSKFDALLTLNTDFSGLRTTSTGCVRMEIPPEYVFGLPVIKFEYEAGMNRAEVTPAAKGVEMPEGQKLTISTPEDDWGCIQTITLHHETYGDYSYESVLGPWYGMLHGVDMGDGVYTYVLVAYATGTIGGSDIVVLRPVDGKLTPVKTFDLSGRSDDIYVQGKFLDSNTLTGTIYPTGTTFKGDVSIAMDERTGTEIWENGTGYMQVELNEEGYYDLIFCTIERNLYNIDTVGSSRTHYVLDEDGELVMTEQTYEFN